MYLSICENHVQIGPWVVHILPPDVRLIGYTERFCEDAPHVLLPVYAPAPFRTFAQMRDVFTGLLVPRLRNFLHFAFGASDVLHGCIFLEQPRIYVTVGANTRLSFRAHVISLGIQRILQCFLGSPDIK